jgi:hypothetical protein
MESALEGLSDIDERTRDEARGILQRMRSTATTVATGAATGAGGAVVGALFRQKLGLP